MLPVIAVVGPTASGKTALSIALAQALGGEIVAMDSMQVYRRMDIGTAKPTLLERQGIPHYMLDVVEPDRTYSVAEYVPQAREALAKIHKTNRTPILVGGTGLYFKALCGGLTLGEAAGDPKLRQTLKAQAETPEGRLALHSRLQEVDPVSAARLHPNDSRRVIRALEVFRATGKPLSAQAGAREAFCPYDIKLLGVGIERPELISRINQRVDQMLAQGLVREVQELLASGVPPESQAMQGLGYKELVPYLAGRQTLEEATGRIKTGTRQYAKRQMTWFRRTPGIQWLDGSDQALAEKALGFLKF